MPQKYVTHPLITPKTLEYRKYQQKLAEKAVQKNLLCVLPTGTGKTMIAILASAEILQKTDGKVLMLAPTKPLCSQHRQTYQESLRLPPEKIRVITGDTRPHQRGAVYQEARVVIATPQTIRNDIQEERLNVSTFRLMVFDEAQRAVKKYAYTYIASAYQEQTDHLRILGLTASPGSSEARIQRICENLSIESVEIRKRSDEALRPYVAQVDVEWQHIHLPPKFQTVKETLEKYYEKEIEFLRDKGFITSTPVPKMKLIQIQQQVRQRLNDEAQPDAVLFDVISRNATAIKLSHALELLETQGISALHEYFQKLKEDDSKAARRLRRAPDFARARRLTEELQEEGMTHPKLSKLRSIVKNYLATHLQARIIVFVRYRDSVEKILEVLKEDNIASEKLIGQRNGLTQEEQIKIVDAFKEGDFSVLVTTSVGEEGLDIPSCKLAIFYDTVPSAIRSIQRRGRVGRTKPGRVIILITKGTREESYYWAAYHRKKKMRKTLEKFQRNGVPSDNTEEKKKQKDLLSFTEKK